MDVVRNISEDRRAGCRLVETRKKRRALTIHVLVLKFPFVARDYSIFEPVLPLIVRQEVCGETANHQMRCTLDSAQGIIHQVQNTAAQHPRVREAQPDDIAVTNIDLGFWWLNCECSVTKRTARQTLLVLRRFNAPRPTTEPSGRG